MKTEEMTQGRAFDRIPWQEEQTILLLHLLLHLARGLLRLRHLKTPASGAEGSNSGADGTTLLWHPPEYK